MNPWWKKPWRLLSLPAGWLWELVGPLGLINRLVPRGGYDRQGGLSYGQLKRQKLDVYTPKGEAAGLPVVVFFYGGSWQSGRRRDYTFVAEALTARGFLTVLPDYRVYPEARFPTFIEDAALAVAWTRDQCGAFGGDASRLFVMGHSAGAHLAAMLALNPAYLDQRGMSARDLRGFIGLAGPYDFLPLKSPRLIKIFGGADDIPETQPITYANPDAPPTLLLHGASDRLVLPKNTLNLARRLRQAGGRVEAKIYPGVKHIRLLISLATPFQDGAPVMEDIAAFIRAQG